MRRLAALVAAFPFAALPPACAPLPERFAHGADGAGPAGEQRQPIINGRLCEPDEQPATVAIFVEMQVRVSAHAGAMRLRLPICTGTVIAPDTVLAAAHCLDEATLRESMQQQFGGHGGNVEIRDLTWAITFQADLSAWKRQPNLPLPEDAVPARAVVVHPEFTLETAGVGLMRLNDIGLLFLDRALEVTPEILVTAEEAAQVTPGQPVVIGGWGQADPDDPNSSSVKRCAESSINELASFEMQIGSDAASSRKCHGDSGGPTYMEVETSLTRKRRVVGVTSHSYDHTDCARGGVDTRVDVYLGWIDGQMRAHCESGTRVSCEVPGVIPPEAYEPPPPPPADEGGGDSAGAGGCATTAPAAGLLVALLPALAVRRRRR